MHRHDQLILSFSYISCPVYWFLRVAHPHYTGQASVLLYLRVSPVQADKEHCREVQERRQEVAHRRRQGYEWFFE